MEAVMLKAALREAEKSISDMRRCLSTYEALLSSFVEVRPCVSTARTESDIAVLPDSLGRLTLIRDSVDAEPSVAEDNVDAFLDSMADFRKGLYESLAKPALDEIVALGGVLVPADGGMPTIKVQGFAPRRNWPRIKTLKKSLLNLPREVWLFNAPERVEALGAMPAPPSSQARPSASQPFPEECEEGPICDCGSMKGICDFSCLDIDDGLMSSLPRDFTLEEGGDEVQEGYGVDGVEEDI